MPHPKQPEKTIAELLQDEQMQLMPSPRPFDGDIEKPVRLSNTTIAHYQRNRYGMTTEPSLVCAPTRSTKAQ